MCGIAGVVNFKSEIKNVDLKIEHFRSSLLHRGPDETGFYQDCNAILLNDRFSIIGKSNGSQPFYSKNKEIISVYNGEIYNFRDLKEELVKDGVVFSKETDGEIIPHLYDKYGPEFMNKLNGEYAIAVYDKRKKELFLGRDRFGVRPLFYSLTSDGVYFSSEIKSILPFIETKKISKNSIYSYMRCSFLKAPITMFENVFQVESANYILLKDNKISEINRYWELPLDREKKKISLDDALYETKQLLVDSVKLRLQSDVPVGVYLSGGVDSSVIAKVVSDNNSDEVSSFTIDFENKSFSEVNKAKEFSGRCNFNHFVYNYNESYVVEHFPRMIKHCESILNTGSAMAFNGLAKFTKNKVDVILGGEGADETFCGYGFHNIEYKKNLYKKWYIKPLLPIIKLYLKSKDRLNDYFPPLDEINEVCETFGVFSPGLQFFARKGKTMASYLKIKEFNEKEGMREVNNQFNYFKEFSKKVDSFDFMTFVDFRTWLEHHLLVVNGDRPSMAETIEARYPYLDYRLVEFVCQLPASHKIKDDISKFLLRSLDIEGIDKKVMNRKKVPFLAPACKPFFSSKLREKYKYIDFMLSEETIKKKGYFETGVIREIFNELDSFHSKKMQKKDKSYGDLHFKESVFLTVLSVHLLDELYIQGNDIKKILSGEFK